VVAGQLTCKPVAEAFGLDYTPVQEAVAAIEADA
jgi:hypothetical protein